MILPLLLAALAFAVLLPIVLPLLRGTGSGPARAVYDQAVYRDQLRELDRDIARGLITGTEAHAARLEIQRRLLAAESGGGGASVARAGDAASVPPPDSPGPTRAPVMALVIAGVVSLGSVALYGLLGEPLSRIDPSVEQTAARQAEIERLVARLRERLAADPNSQEGWRLYARTTAAMADWDTAVTAYQRAIALGDGSVDTLAAYAEVLVARARGVVTPLARETFRIVLDREPDYGMARFYLAVAAGQDGQPAEAIRQLQALAADLPGDAPVRVELARRIADIATEAGMAPPTLAAGKPPMATAAGSPSVGPPAPAAPVPGSPATGPAPGPDQATMDAAATMPAADRAAMIRAMVARLAERLEREPDDRDGWMRLGQSWSVLNEPDKAADAYERAAALAPDDVAARLRAVEVLLRGRAVSDPLPSRVVAILRQIETVRPDEPAVLWYLGLAAARDGRKDAALAYWRRLRDGLPPDHPDAAMARQAIEALGGR